MENQLNSEDRKQKTYRTYKITHALHVGDVVKLTNFELLQSKEIYNINTKEKVSVRLKNDYTTDMEVIQTNKWKSKKQLAGSITTYLFSCILEDLIHNNSTFIFPLFRGQIKFNTLTMPRLKFKLSKGIYQEVDLFKTDKSVYFLELIFYKGKIQKKKRIHLNMTTYKEEILYKANEGEVFVSYIEKRYKDYVSKVCDKFNQVDRIRMHYYIKNLLSSIITQLLRGHEIYIFNMSLMFHIYRNTPGLRLHRYQSAKALIRKKEMMSNIEKYKIYLNKTDKINLDKLEQYGTSK